MTTTNPLVLNPDDEFESVLIDILKMHRKKAAVYGTEEDAMQNFYDGAYMTGTTPLRQCEALANKHNAALKQWFAKEPRSAFDPASTKTSDDAMIDRPVYTVLATVLYRRMKAI